MSSEKTNTNGILLELEFFRALVVDIDDALDDNDPQKAAKLVDEAKNKIDSVIKDLQYHGGI